MLSFKGNLSSFKANENFTQNERKTDQPHAHASMLPFILLSHNKEMVYLNNKWQSFCFPAINVKFSHLLKT